MSLGAQIRAYLHGQRPLPSATETWQQTKTLKTAEEFRLLYVAIPRAKQLLWLSAAQQAPYSWRSFNCFNWEQKTDLSLQQPCPFLPALKRQVPDCLVRS
jgi:DNA helicase-2/ATP-dependent DNA helicase PcrA